jgi:hypothetical protein
MIKEYLDKISMSRIQTLRSMGGKKWEESMIESGESYGVVDARKVYITSSTEGKVHLDGLINDNIMLELTTSADHSKLATIQKQSRLWKERYPNRKFVVGLKVIKTPRKIDGKDSVYDQLLKTESIDNVLVGEEEILKFFIKPSWDKQEKIDKLNNNNNKITQRKITMSNDINSIIIREAIKVYGNPIDFVQKMYNMDTTNMTSRTSSTDSTKDLKKSYYEMGGDNVTEVTESYEEFISLADLGYKNVSRFMGSKLATQIMDKDGKLLMKPNGLSQPYKYGIDSSFSDLISNKR